MSISSVRAMMPIIVSMQVPSAVGDKVGGREAFAAALIVFGRVGAELGT